MKTRLKFLVLVVLLSVTFANCIRKPSYNTETNLTAAITPSPTPQKPCALPNNGTHVSDFAQVVNPDTKVALEEKLKAWKNRASIDFAVVTMKTTGDQPIADYSLSLARCWEVGAKNPDGAGMLLLVAIDDRKWHLQISRVIEKHLSNEEIQDAGALMTPHMRTGNYSEGLQKFVDATLEILGRRRGFPIKLNQ